MTAYNWRKLLSRHGRSGGFLARLRRDQRGNTLALMAAALIPMIAMVGSAVDISRAYLVKTRLQQACDAGVLAARRTMTGQSIAADTNAKTQATNFFNINLKNGAYGATVTSIAVTDVNDAANKPTGTVHGVASADVPTSLMKIFGKPKLTMNVTCESELQVSNNDVMFVLDVTGSMNCPAATPSCGNNNDVEASGSKISAVRTGVLDFYDTLAAATTAEARLRIGIVPYSSNVNVGKLLPANYIADTWNYQSRVAAFTTPAYVGTTGSPTGAGVDIYGTSMTQANCALYGQNKQATDQNGNTVNGGSNPAVISGGPPPAATITRAYSNNNATGVDWGWPGAPDTTGNNQSCRRSWVQAPMTYVTRYTVSNSGVVWTYQQDQYDTSQFKLGNTVTFANPNNLAGVTVPTSGSYNMQEIAANGQGVTTMTMNAWQGCLEERDTVSNATFPTIPSNAYDLQIDLLPSSSATSWHPWWPELIWDRSGTAASSSTGGQPGGDAVVCPKQAAKLAVMSHADVSNYVNASDFKARGGTYHDFGMLWGARLLSPTGIFASENSTAPNGENINRHIIFMTDGDMAPQPIIYGLYGYEKVDRRISGSANTPGNPDLTNRHNARFSAICEAIKNMNITIWVVAYDQTMTTELQNCASPGKSFYAANDTQMKAALKTIAQQIAELRLSK